MESKVLKEYGVPGYPKKEQVQSQPSLLRKSFDKRWQKLFDVGISGMLAASITLSGCQEGHKANNNTLQSSQTEDLQSSDKSIAKTESVKKLKKIVAPVFKHGDGRGSIGCVAVAPPAFVSEEEALVVIREELTKNGIDLNKENVVLSGAKVKPIGYGILEMLGMGKKRPFPLEIDSQDSEKQINIEFVSMSDCRELGGIKEGWFTFEKYDMKKAAVHFRKQIKSNKEKGIFGVFYDPAPKHPLNSQPHEEVRSWTQEKIHAAHQENIKYAKELLRNQVSDFAQWLKEQGVI